MSVCCIVIQRVVSVFGVSRGRCGRAEKKGGGPRDNTSRRSLGGP